MNKLLLKSSVINLYKSNSTNNSYKVGNSVIVSPIIIIICSLMIIFIGVYIIDSIIPFIYQQKLNNIAQKYMFVIERFGYLTDEEMNTLKKDLVNAGYDISKIEIQAPSSIKEYGELIQFEIKYTLLINVPDLSKFNYSMKKRETVIIIRKNSFSKI